MVTMTMMNIDMSVYWFDMSVDGNWHFVLNQYGVWYWNWHGLDNFHWHRVGVLYFDSVWNVDVHWYLDGYWDGFVNLHGNIPVNFDFVWAWHWHLIGAIDGYINRSWHL